MAVYYVLCMLYFASLKHQAYLSLVGLAQFKMDRPAWFKTS